MREVPASREAEMGVLGSILLDPRSISNAFITEDEFYYNMHSILYRNLKEMSSTGRPMDALTIAEYMKKKGVLDSVGSYAYLEELQNHALVPDNIAHYCEEVREKAKLRRNIEACERAINEAYRGVDASGELMADLMSDSGQEDTGGPTDEHIIERWKKAASGEISNIPFPFEKMNVLTGGIRQGMHTVFCGRSGSGKSMFLSTWYNHLGSENFPILVMPFEDKAEVTKTRMAANLGRYPWGLIQNGGEWVKMDGRFERRNVTEAELDKASRCLKAVSKMPVFFYEKRCTPDELFSIANRYKVRNGIRAMFIDGAKDIRRPSGKYSDTGFDEEISQALCYIAERLDIAVVSVHHLTKIPDDSLISSLNVRGSGNIISDCRMAIALQDKGLKDVSYDEEGRQTTRALDIIKTNHCRYGGIKLETDLRSIQMWEV